MFGSILKKVDQATVPTPSYSPAHTGHGPAASTNYTYFSHSVLLLLHLIPFVTWLNSLLPPPPSTTAPGEPWQGPLELAQELGLGLLMCPLVAVLQHLAIAKLYARDKQMAASQEMLALGVCQAVGAFTGSMAVTAAFSRWEDWLAGAGRRLRAATVGPV